MRTGASMKSPISAKSSTKSRTSRTSSHRRGDEFQVLATVHLRVEATREAERHEIRADREIPPRSASRCRPEAGSAWICPPVDAQDAVARAAIEAAADVPEHHALVPGDAVIFRDVCED